MAHYQGSAIAGQMLNEPMVYSSMGEKMAALSVVAELECHKFQKDYFRCVAAFGHPRARKFCDFEFRDLMECETPRKSILRHQEMEKERQKQFLTGQRDRVYEHGFPKLYDTVNDHFTNSNYTSF